MEWVITSFAGAFAFGFMGKFAWGKLVDKFGPTPVGGVYVRRIFGRYFLGFESFSGADCTDRDKRVGGSRVCNWMCISFF